MSLHANLAFSIPPDAGPGSIGLAGGDLLIAVVAFAALFVLFGTRPFARSHDAGPDGSTGCGACDGAACGAGGCATAPPAPPAEEAS